MERTVARLLRAVGVEPWRRGKQLVEVEGPELVPGAGAGGGSELLGQASVL